MLRCLLMPLCLQCTHIKYVPYVCKQVFSGILCIPCYIDFGFYSHSHTNLSLWSFDGGFDVQRLVISNLASLQTYLNNILHRFRVSDMNKQYIGHQVIQYSILHSYHKIFFLCQCHLKTVQNKYLVCNYLKKANILPIQ